LVTGTGLKDIHSAQQLVQIPDAINPNIDSFKKNWRKIGG